MKRYLFRCLVRRVTGEPREPIRQVLDHRQPIVLAEPESRLLDHAVWIYGRRVADGHRGRAADSSELEADMLSRVLDWAIVVAFGVFLGYMAARGIA